MKCKRPLPHEIRETSTAISRGLAADETARLKGRLALVGLLLTPERLPAKRPEAEVLNRARVAAGRGRPLSDLIAEGRR